MVKNINWQFTEVKNSKKMWKEVPFFLAKQMQNTMTVRFPFQPVQNGKDYNSVDRSLFSSGLIFQQQSTVWGGHLSLTWSQTLLLSAAL